MEVERFLRTELAGGEDLVTDAGEVGDEFLHAVVLEVLAHVRDGGG
jgi:hypothetical protein